MSSPRLPASLSRFLPDVFTRLLIATVVLATVLPASGAAVPVVDRVTDVGIALMFFLYGARLAPKAVVDGATHWRLHLLVFASTFALFPLLGLLIGRLPEAILPHDLAVGLLFLCLLPSTIQSSLAFTAIAGGNVPAAMCSATISNLAGTVVTPALVGLLLSGEQGTPMLDAVVQIVELLLLPFALGQISRPWIGGFVARHKSLLGMVDRGTILLVVYGAFGKAVQEGIWHALPPASLGVVLAIEAVLLATVLTLTGVAARAFGFDRADEIAIVFCGSKKSLATGVPMAGVLFAGPTLGTVLLPVMLFHQMQLMVCAVLARRWGAETAEATAAEAA